MEGVNKAKPASSTMALTEFHFYPRLPVELKLMVWVYVFEALPPGAHRFRLLPDPNNEHKLIVRPDKDQKEDASAWRQRRALARTDKYALDGLLRFERRATLLYTDTAHRRTVRKEENGITAMIDGGIDLVTFRFNYGTSRVSLTLLQPSQNAETFAGITQIGVELSFFGVGSVPSYKFRPFAYPCTHNNVCGAFFCCEGMIRFIRFFKDLKMFYLIVPLTLQNLNGGPNSLYGRPLRPHLRASASGGARTRMTQVSLNVFNMIKEAAQQKGLKQFHDRNGTYCEFPLDNYRRKILGPVLKHDVSGILAVLRREWTAYHNRMAIYDNRIEIQRKCWKGVEFKLLVWADLRGVTVEGGDERPLRTFAPWN
ncbi:hypothetical protein NUW58_g2629 [Xylaria curta]|uniref:Uncharacterized protein n=1 Tax=Xylaria curta TaxID=42375 RepID=A0ACC1PFL2_9PEZI|nr:hypothetical protein NUW58_g2629 [Xylaria curta]